MNLQSADFVVQEVTTNIRRDRAITLATIGVISVTICVLGAVMLFFLNLSLWTNRLAGELITNLYLKPEITRAQATTLKAEIAGWEGVQSAKIVTKEEGWENFKASNPGLEHLGEFPIPVTDRIEVRTTSADLLPQVSERLAALPEAKQLVPTPKEIADQKGIPQKTLRLKRGVRFVGYLLAFIMILAAFLIVHNTIRLSLIARRREISIMQLVGATPGFVAAPFVMEGAVHGFIGSLLACAFLVPTHMYLHAIAANSDWALFKLLPDRQLFYIAIALVCVGILLGVCGAILSFRRFLVQLAESESH